MTSVRSWLLAARPKTLTAAVVPIAVASALAYSKSRDGGAAATFAGATFAGATLAGATQAAFRPELSLFALLSAVFIQIGTNLVNDAIDFRKGADTEKRIGPTRVTQRGLLTPGQVMGGGFLCLAIAMAAGIPLVLAGGWTMVTIGVVSLFFAYGYTGGPFPLAYLGLGDLFVLLFFGLVAVGGVYWLQTGAFDFDAMVAGTQIGLLATVLIAVNNLRDRAQDLLVHKKTLAVRLGVAGSRAEIAVLCLAPFVLNFHWWLREMRAAALLPLLSLPLAIRLIRVIFSTEPGPLYNRYLAQAAGLHLLFGILWAVGCLV